VGLVRALLLVFLVVASAQASASTGFVNCDSISYRYQFCSVNTQGRVAMIRENSSGNLCRQGRGWGYDDNGIWVEDGCRAEFEIHQKPQQSGG